MCCWVYVGNWRIICFSSYLFIWPDSVRKVHNTFSTKSLPLTCMEVVYIYKPLFKMFCSFCCLSHFREALLMSIYSLPSSLDTRQSRKHFPNVVKKVTPQGWCEKDFVRVVEVLIFKTSAYMVLGRPEAHGTVEETSGCFYSRVLLL